jgi:hypothetical protein
VNGAGNFLGVRESSRGAAVEVEWLFFVLSSLRALRVD